MSVLFQALSRAARDYSDQQSSIVVPIMPLVPRRTRARRTRASLVVAVMMVGVAVGFFLLLTKTGISQAPVTIAAAPPPAVPTPVAVVSEEVAVMAPEAPKTAAEAPAPVEPSTGQGKTVTTEPQGIALPVDSLAVPSLEAPAATAEVAQQLQDVPALANSNKNKEPAPRVVVSTSNAPPTARLLREARAQTTARHYAEAVELYDEVLAKDGNDQDAWKGKAYALQQSGTAAAREELQKMIAVRPFSAPAQAGLARVLMQQGDHEGAQAAWQRAIELEPANKTYRLSLAILYDRMGKDDAALEVYKQIPAPLSPVVKQRLEYLAAHAVAPNTP